MMIEINTEALAAIHLYAELGKYDHVAKCAIQYFGVKGDDALDLADWLLDDPEVNIWLWKAINTQLPPQISFDALHQFPIANMNQWSLEIVFKHKKWMFIANRKNSYSASHMHLGDSEVEARSNWEDHGYDMLERFL